MSEPDLLQRQRKILCALRQATARRAQTEADAAAQLAEARQAQEEAQAALAQAGLQSLLEQTRPTLPAAYPGVNPAQELLYCVSTAAETTERVQADVEELQLQRKRKAELRKRLVTASALALWGILVVGAAIFALWLAGRYTGM